MAARFKASLYVNLLFYGIIGFIAVGALCFVVFVKSECGEMVREIVAPIGWFMHTL